MKRFIASLAVACLMAAAVPTVEAQSRGRSGSGSFSSAFQRGLGFSLGARLGGGFGGGFGVSPFRASPFISPFRASPVFFGGPQFRTSPLLFGAPLIRSRTIFIDDEPLFIEHPRTERIIIIR